MSKCRFNPDSLLCTNSGCTWTQQESKRVKMSDIYTAATQHLSHTERLRHPRASARAERCWYTLTDPDKNNRSIYKCEASGGFAPPSSHLPPSTHTILRTWQPRSRSSPAVHCSNAQTDEEALLTSSSGDPSCCNAGIKNRIKGGLIHNPKHCHHPERRIACFFDCTCRYTSVPVKD